MQQLEWVASQVTQQPPPAPHPQVTVQEDLMVSMIVKENPDITLIMYSQEAAGCSVYKMFLGNLASGEILCEM